MNLIELLAYRFILFSAIFKGICSSKWEYSGPKGTNKWSSIQPICGHKSQSPININTADLYPNPSLGLLHLNGYLQSLTGGNVINNGHTVQLNFPKNKLFRLSGKGINGNYTALQLHFHWRAAEASTGGSEHTVNGKHHQIEMHIVHIKDPFKKLDDIKDIRDGLAVIGVFLSVDEDAEDNASFEKLLNTISRCHFQGDTVELANGPSLLSLLPDSGSYYRYSGSLTTPPCYESVLWTVYKEPVSISKRQLKIFQNLTSASSETTSASNVHKRGRGNDGNRVKSESLSQVEPDLSDNYRPVQPLNGRIVSAFYDIDISPKSNTKKNHGWDYEGKNGPSHWHDEYPICKQKKQSPIDLLACTPTLSSELKNLQFSSTYDKPTSGHVMNNGHTIQYSLQVDKDLEFWETNKKYKVLQLHFHWGKASVKGKSVDHSGGSEHTKKGYHYPVEMHIVHKKIVKDGNKDDDLAVLGVFFEVAKSHERVSNKAQKALAKITDLFQKVEFKGEKVDLERGPALNDLLPTNKSYYRYMGSLTTPPCSEAVMWTVLQHPLYITRDKFLEFQSLMKVERSEVTKKSSTTSSNTGNVMGDASILDDVLLVDNYRPVQPCNGRQVQVYIDKKHERASPPVTDTASIVVWTLVGVVVFCAVLGMMIFWRRKERNDDQKVNYTKGQNSSAKAQSSIGIEISSDV